MRVRYGGGAKAKAQRGNSLVGTEQLDRSNDVVNLHKLIWFVQINDEIIPDCFFGSPRADVFLYSDMRVIK